MSIGFGTKETLSKHELLNLISSKLESMSSSIAKVISEVPKLIETAIIPLTSLINSNHQELLQRIKRLEEKIDYQTEQIECLTAELSRFNSDSDELMVSAFAFCTIYGISFSTKDLALIGKKATRLSRQLGFDVQQVQDPRFGFVNLYNCRVLEQMLLTEGDNNE